MANPPAILTFFLGTYYINGVFELDSKISKTWLDHPVKFQRQSQCVCVWVQLLTFSFGSFESGRTRSLALQLKIPQNDLSSARSTRRAIN